MMKGPWIVAVLCAVVGCCYGGDVDVPLWPESLGEGAEFYMYSDLRGEVPVQLAPERRGEFICKLNRLGMMENRRELSYRMEHKKVPTNKKEFHSYELRCREGGREYARGFLLREQSRLGGYSMNEFDAEAYLTPGSWKTVREKLAIPGVDDAIPRAAADSAGEQWEPLPEKLERWRYPEELTAQEELHFYMDGGERGCVELELVPELREEFVRKINRLGKLQNEGKRESAAMPTAFDLRCETASTVYKKAFWTRNDTWVGGPNISEFDARKYITPRSWEEVMSKKEKTDQLLFGSGRVGSALAGDVWEDELGEDAETPACPLPPADDVERDSEPAEDGEYNSEDELCDAETLSEEEWKELEREEDAWEAARAKMEYCLPRDLRPGDVLRVSLLSKIGKGEVELEFVPGMQEAFMAQINRLAKLEQEAHYKEGVFHLPHCLSYGLRCTTDKHAYAETYYMKHQTWVGDGFSGLWFDAAPYFTAASWRAAEEKLRTARDIESDTACPATCGTREPQQTPSAPSPLPKARELPQALSPREAVVFYMRSTVGKGEVELQLVPELREEFISKLNHLSKPKSEGVGDGMPCLRTGNLYKLCCRTAEKDYAEGWLVCGMSWIVGPGGEFNAKPYITPESWEDVRKRFRDEQVDTRQEHDYRSR